MSDRGCQWVVGRGKKWNSARRAFDSVPVHCLKLVDTDSDLCPKHKLMAATMKREQNPTGIYAYEPKGR
jgi:hypothetical protein